MVFLPQRFEHISTDGNPLHDGFESCGLSAIHCSKVEPSNSRFAFDSSIVLEKRS
jgi:hypothetical protein